MKAKEIKTIDVTSKEWFDKVNGNGYFSARVVINYGLPGIQTLFIPFQYGYGRQYEYAALEAICNNSDLVSMGSMWQTCDANGIILRLNRIENCKKRDVIAFGKS